MASDKHPSWFKLKQERRELLQAIPPDSAIKVILSCFDYLDTRTRSDQLTGIEGIAFAAFMPDLEEAWDKYSQRVNARKGHRSTDIGRYHTTSSDTEEETETESETESEDKKNRDKADKPPTRHTFSPPEVEDVQAYCQEKGYTIDPEKFVDFYESNG